MINIVVAIGINNEIGKDNSMLWKNSEDLKFFKKLTLNHKIIMGKNTYYSIGKVLEKRENIIISKSIKYIENATVMNNLEEILKKYENSSEEVFVIGGQSIYNQSLKYANKIYVSVINKTFIEANKFFPKIDKKIFELIEEKEYNTYILKVYKNRRNDE